MPTKGFVTVEDFSGEQSTVSFHVQDVGAANFGSVTQDIDEVKDAIQAVILGVVRKAGFTKDYPESFATVSNANAQREKKWLVAYRDTTQFLDAANTIANQGYGKNFTLEIPTANLGIADILTPGTDMMDLVSSAGNALRVALTDNIRSPYNANAVAPTISITGIYFVGRNT